MRRFQTYSAAAAAVAVGALQKLSRHVSRRTHSPVEFEKFQTNPITHAAQGRGCARRGKGRATTTSLHCEFARGARVRTVTLARTYGEDYECHVNAWTRTQMCKGQHRSGCIRVPNACVFVSVCVCVCTCVGRAFRDTSRQKHEAPTYFSMFEPASLLGVSFFSLSEPAA